MPECCYVPAVTCSSRSFWASLGTTVLATLLAIAPASAAEETLTVRNLAQPGMISTVPQAPAVITSQGECGDTRTVDEANGEESPCPAGTWPVQGDQSWFTPTVDASAGDTLELTFSPAPDFVYVSVTTAFPIGLRTPPCPSLPTGPVPCANGDVLVPNTGITLIAFPDVDDPSVFPVKLPAPWPGTQVAVTAAGPAAAAANYAFGLASPRWENETLRCGTAFFAPGDTRSVCPGDDIEGGVPEDVPSPAAKTPTAKAPAAQTPAAEMRAAQAPPPETPVTTIPPPPAPTLRLTPAPTLRGNRLTVSTSSSGAGKLTIALRRGKTTIVRRVSSVPAGTTQRAITLRRTQWRKLAKYPRRKYSLVTTLETGGKIVAARATVRWRAPKS